MPTIRHSEAVRNLRAYEAELQEVLERFTRTPRAVHIAPEDDARYREAVVELRDYFTDLLGPDNVYSAEIVALFNEGVGNFSGSPSFKSVESIKGVVTAAAKRLERNPDLLRKRPRAQGPDEIPPPRTVSLAWLAKNVPARFWITALGVLFVVFLAGVSLGQLPEIQRILEVLPFVDYRAAHQEEHEAARLDLPAYLDKISAAYNKRLGHLQEAIVAQEARLENAEYAWEEQRLEESLERLRRDLAELQRQYAAHEEFVRSLVKVSETPLDGD